MCSRYPEIGVLRWRRIQGGAVVAGMLMSFTAWAAAPPLRICADPDNPPFSQRDQSGFENRIAQLLADDLKRPLQYTWLRDRRGFVRKTIGAGLCDLIVGVPVGFPTLRTSLAYYRSTYYFVNRRDDATPLVSFEDPHLLHRRIGVQLIGIDPGTSPVGLALARHGATEHVVGFTAASDDRPPAERMVQAVAEGTLDSALVWGPQAGHFVQQSPVPLRLDRVQVPADLAQLPFQFAIAMGVRQDDEALLNDVNSFLIRRRTEIDAMLAARSVPRTDLRGQP